MNIPRLAFALLILISGGCSVVVIDEPVGDQFTPEQLQEFVGVWVNEKGDPSPVEFRATDDGRLITGNLKWDEEQQKFEVETQVLLPRQLAGQTYLYFPDSKLEHKHLFVRVELQQNQKMVIYLPEPDSFRAAVEGGTLPGRVEVTDEKKQHFSVYLQAQSEATRKFLASADWQKYYTKEPLVLNRLKASAEPAEAAEESSAP